MMRPAISPLQEDMDQERRNDLPWLDGTILAVMRTWVLACKRRVPADGAVRTIFANLRALEASEHLNRFMTALSEGCTRTIHVHCTCEPYLSADEALLLDIFALTQEGQADTATDLLLTFVNTASACAATEEATAIVKLLNGSGNVIGRGPDAVRRHVPDRDRGFARMRIRTRLH
jgi:hypothetical protein